MPTTMRTTILSFLLCLFWLSTIAQAPQAFSYQTVVRDLSGKALVNKTVTFRISILQGSATGTTLYSELHTKTTTDFGLADMEIGKGTVLSGSFSGINWGSGNYFMKVEIDPAGGTAYQEIGTSQLLSVPYALYAKTAGNITGTTVETDPTWVGDANSNAEIGRIGSVGIGTTEPANSAILDVSSTSKGSLLPRMTYKERKGIQNPAEGLIVFCTDCSADGSGVLSIFQGGNWKTISMDCARPNKPIGGKHIPLLKEIVWNWNSVPIADGYKWNTFNDYSSALDLGSNVTYTETGKECGENYARYVWAYNACGKSDSLILIQSTDFCYIPGNGVTDITGFTYKTIIIGVQEWMAWDLITYKYNNGDTIPNITDVNAWHNSTKGAFTSKPMKYYNWFAVNDIRGICPAGWHVPTDSDWAILINYLGGEMVAGKKMRSTDSFPPECRGTNTSGFDGYLYGWVNDYLELQSKGEYGFWFSSTEVNQPELAHKASVSCHDDSAYSALLTTKKFGHTVRCIKNQ
jgi:uncharacterized protein (TIGR02145 family)